ncbi:MAG: carboxymuconolactone decarboxylase family protein [Burkholderiales bacterium]
MTIYEKTLATRKPVTEVRCAVLPERMPVIPEEKLTDAQRKVGADIASTPRRSVRGPFVAMMRSPGLASRMQQLGAFIRFECELDKRVNVLAGLIVARQWTHHYIWNGHIKQALEAGISQAVVDALGEGRRPTGMSELEETTYDFLTELYANKGVSDATYKRAEKALGEQGIVELVGVAGYFSINAMIMNVARTPLRDGGAPTLAQMPRQLMPIG